MYFDKMCEGGPRRLVQCDGNAGLRPVWAPGQHWAKERLGERCRSLEDFIGQDPNYNHVFPNARVRHLSHRSLNRPQLSLRSRSWFVPFIEPLFLNAISQ